MDNILFTNTSMTMRDERVEKKVREFLITALGEEDTNIRKDVVQVLGKTRNPEALLFIEVFYRGNDRRACEITNTALLERLARSRYEPVAEKASQLLISNGVDITAKIKKIPASEIFQDKKPAKKQFRNSIKS